MLFNQIIGQEHIKNHLLTSAKNGRIPHAQLFIGKEGSGTLPVAIAYAQFLLSHFSSFYEISPYTYQYIFFYKRKIEN